MSRSQNLFTHFSLRLFWVNFFECPYPGVLFYNFSCYNATLGILDALYLEIFHQPLIEPVLRQPPSRVPLPLSRDTKPRLGFSENREAWYVPLLQTASAPTGVSSPRCNLLEKMVINTNRPLQSRPRLGPRLLLRCTSSVAASWGGWISDL